MGNISYKKIKIKARKVMRHDKAFIFNRDKFVCLKCGEWEREYLTIDHVVPLGKGGTNERSNMQTLCLQCNQEKADTIKDYRTACDPVNK